MGDYKYVKTITVDDIYQYGWFQRNREKLDLEHEWKFDMPSKGDTILDTLDGGIHAFTFQGWSGHENPYPVIIITGRKPRFEYSTDAKLRTPQEGDYVIEDVSHEIQEFKYGDHSRRERIILSKREVK